MSPHLSGSISSTYQSTCVRHYFLSSGTALTTDPSYASGQSFPSGSTAHLPRSGLNAWPSAHSHDIALSSWQRKNILQFAGSGKSLLPGRSKSPEDFTAFGGTLSVQFTFAAQPQACASKLKYRPSLQGMYCVVEAVH